MTNWIQKLLIVAALSGISAAQAQANTAPASGANPEPVEVQTFSVPATPAPAAASTSPAATPAATPVASAEATPARRIALLLPLRSETLGPVAEVLKQGFLAAHEIEADGISVDVVESGESGADVLDNYQLALSQHDVIVGPLSRAGIDTLIASGGVAKPTLALNVPENKAERLPPNLLLMGLSLEEEARQLAQWAAAHTPKGARALVLSSNVAWQRRAAKAFIQQWQKLGLDSQAQELYSSSSFFSANSLSQLKTRLQNDKDKTFSIAFLALDAEQARQLRPLLPPELTLYATSQINRIALQDLELLDPLPYLDGVRLLELPWQFQRDHTAVMVYPRLIQSNEQRHSADLERMYALGVDAYRVARALALRPGATLELDGVTGRLNVNLKKNGASVERIYPQAIYRQGLVQPYLPNPGNSTQ